MNVISAFPSIDVLNSNDAAELFIEGNYKFMQFAIFIPSQNLFYGIKQIINDKNNKIEEIINTLIQDKLLSQCNINRVVYAFNSYRAMLVPQTLFDAQHLNDFLKFHHKIEEQEDIYYHFIPQAEAFLIFSCPTYVENILKNKFSSVDFKHHTIPFIHMALQNEINSHQPIIHIFLGDNFFDILVLKQNKIQLFNSFYYQKYSDVLYFLVNIANLFSLPCNTSQLFISGNIQKESYQNIFNELKGIFPLLHNENNLPEAYNYSSEILALPGYQIRTLVGLKTCE